MNIDPSIFEQEDINNIFDDIAEQVFTEFEEVPFDDLDEAAQHCIVLVGLDDQVYNGGFLQYIEGNSGDFFQETVNAAKAINNQGLIDALDKVANQFPNKYVPEASDRRLEILENLIEENDRSVPFNELDAETKAEIMSNHDGSFPIEECSFAIEETEWTKTWEDLDDWYYDNAETIYQDFIAYLKAQNA